MTNNKFVEARLSANAEYQKPINTILSLSTAAIVAPAIFIFGPSSGPPHLDVHTWILVVLCWVSLGAAMFCCVQFFEASGDWVKFLLEREVESENSAEYSQLKMQLDRYFAWARNFFLIGIFGLALLLVLMAK